MKWFFYRYHLWLTIPLIVGSTLAALRLVPPEQFPAVCVSIVGTGLGITYFLHKQKLEELKLFKDLFEQFNKRYDDFNEELTKISTKDELGPADKAVLIDYFNLCGEEYLYFRLGLVPSQVFGAWRNGKKQWLECPLIKDAWEIEQETDSYYGLTAKVICK